MTKTLFEITEEHLETGLRAYPVGYCTTSTVDPEKGLFYAGQPVDQLISWEPEEVIYLLWSGKPGWPEEIKKFTQDLKGREKCSPELIKQIQLLPRKGHPMQLFTASILLAGMFECKDDYREDALNLIAKIPEITATVSTPMPAGVKALLRSRSWVT